MQQLHFVDIPTNQIFLNQWHAWIHGKVAKHFKRDKSRMSDTAQNVRLRLLTKDFIGRWFFKHLTDELVELEEATRILGDVPVALVGHLKPAFVFTKDQCEIAKTKYVAVDEERRQWLAGLKDKQKIRLYRVSDLLKFGHFDYERFYYSVQNHTIDSGKALRLLGYPETQYTALQSMWRKRGFKPSELTEHGCGGAEDCAECERGRALLRSRRLSLAHNWGDPSVADAAARLRWNDSQLKPYLREWRRSNMVKTTPRKIVRLAPNPGIDQGLLKYANIILDNEVTNDFKRMSRADDLESFVRTNAVCPELSNDEVTGWDADNRPRGEERPERVFRDTSASGRVREFETMRDLSTVMRNSGLTDEEVDIVRKLELDEMSARTYSETTGMPVARVNKLRLSAMAKMKLPFFRNGSANQLVELAAKHGCEVEDIVDPSVTIGKAVLARTDMFYNLHRLGMSVPAMATAFRFSVDRVELSLSRHPEMRGLPVTLDDTAEEVV
jgi:hypothetical protein